MGFDAITGAVLNFVLKVLGALLDRFRGRHPRRYEPRLAVIPEGRINACSWGPGRSPGKVWTAPMVDLHVTNMGDRPVELSSARIRLRTGFARWQTFSGSASVSIQHRGLPRDLLPPGVMMNVRAHFMIPLEHKPGTFQASVALIDQFGRWHWARRVGFRDSRQPIHEL